MKVSVLGAGAEGTGLAALLASESDVEEIRLGDIDGARLQRSADLVRAQKTSAVVHTMTVDGTNSDAVAKWAIGTDVLVNATMPAVNLPTMKACLQARVHYVDLNSAPFPLPGVVRYEETIDAQFELNDAFTAAQLTAISCAGVAPGWVDLVARYICDQLDVVDSIIVRWVERNDGRELVSTVGPWLIANFNMPTQMRWHDHRLEEVDFIDSEEIYEWPAPLGLIPVYTGFLHPELRTMRNLNRDIGHIEVRSGLSNGRWKDSRAVWIEALRRQLGPNAATSISDLPVRLGSSFISPDGYAKALEGGIVTEGTFAVCVQGRGQRRGQLIDHTVYMLVTLAEAMRMVPWFTHMVCATIGTTPITIVPMLARGEITQRGVIGVGALDSWRTILERIASRGFAMSEKIVRSGPFRPAD